MKKKIPTSSYRLQLSKNFCFAKAISTLPYLKMLGVEMVYTSPYFEIVSNSFNPYMIITPLKISKDLGGEKAFILFCEECKKLSLLHMMDIVPNHMAVSLENPWWEDVVKNKEKSPYAHFFDIDWDGGNGELILPGTVDIHSKINYRRFFDICEMVGINIDDEEFYTLYFSKIRQYVANGWIEGFRVDHIDGLKYPKQFLEKIHIDFPHLYISLEKILDEGELIRKDWKADGSVGYDVLFLIDQVLLDHEGEEIFSKLFEKYGEEEVNLEEIKISYLNHYLISEVERFSRWFGVEKSELLKFLAHFPIYRTYIDENKIDPLDKEAIEYAASFTNGNFFLEDIFKKEHRETLIRLQQILPAVYAKGFEDTYNYRYTRFCSLNEVGGNPKQFSISNERFHQRIEAIYTHFPHTMHTLSTHDTKRSLDARMRIHVLAEIPEEYQKNLTTWLSIVPPFESSRMMCFFFQNLIAISSNNIEDRMVKYMIKSAREGKYYSDHLDPDEEFEKTMKEWIYQVLYDKKFMETFLPFKEKVSKAAEMKSISALVIQMGLFGVMDLYQGEELVNANLVDPDNRRDVDFDKRMRAISDGSSMKMNILKKGLHFRLTHRDLILNGTYSPVETNKNQLGYRRCYKDQELIVIINKYHLGKKSNEKITVEGGKSVFEQNLPFGIFLLDKHKK